MMDNQHLRGIILKLENRLSDDDRKRLHFFLGNNVPRRIRDDPSLGGTLSLMESLFDQDKINEQDFTFLINAFDEIQCMDAVKILREHMRRMQSNTLNQSIQSLASIMPLTIEQSVEAEEEDKYAMKRLLITEQTSSNNSIEMIGMNNTKITPVIEIIDNQSSQSNQKKYSNRSSMTLKYLLSFALLLSIVGLGIVTAMIIIRSRQFTKELQLKDKNISEKQAENNQILQQRNHLRSMINQTTQDLIAQLQHSLHERKQQNKTIQRLNSLRSTDNQTIEQLYSLQAMNNQTKQHLVDQLQRSHNEQTKQNETIERLNTLRLGDNQTIEQITKQLQQSQKEQTKNNQTIERLNNLWRVDNQTIRQLTNQLKQSLKEQTKNNETIQQLTDQLRKSFDKQTKQNETIERLNILQSVDNQTIRRLTDQSKQLLQEQVKNNQTMQQLTDQLQKSLDKQTKQSETIEQLNILQSVNNQTIQHLNNQLRQLRENSTPSHINHVTALYSKASEPTKVTDPISTQKPALLRHVHIEPNTSWRQNGVTVAGSVKDDDGFNLLLSPFGFEVDDDQTIVIADYFNHRVIEWRSGATSGQVVAGGEKRGNRNDQLNYPTDLIIDKQVDKLIICDRENWRVVRWPRRGGKSGETIISYVKCFGLTMDANRFLYVSDLEKHEVRRWRIGETQGTLVAGGNGRGNRADQLNSPHYIFIDGDQSIFVSDSQNHRVMKWVKDAKEGIVVAGGQGEGSAFTQLSSSEGIFVDQLGSVYVADCSNYRVMRWPKGATHGSLVVGNEYRNRVNPLSRPMGLSFDSYGNLYVADYDNHRVQKFDVNRIG